MRPDPAPPIVFAGISLSRAEVSSLISADARPPVRRGDLDPVRPGESVAIIDGELDPAARLPIAEVHRALLRGVTITGAASLGALLAHEAGAQGMEGAGWVYETYRIGRIDGVDEIAVVYDPDTHRPLTIPLVNIRFCLDMLMMSAVVTTCEVDDAMSALKGLGVELREPRAIRRQLMQVFGRRRFVSALRDMPMTWDIKRRDASMLLRDMAAAAECRHLHPRSRATVAGESRALTDARGDGAG